MCEIPMHLVANAPTILILVKMLAPSFAAKPLSLVRSLPRSGVRPSIDGRSSSRSTS